MTTKFKAGDRVRQVVPAPIEGVVSKFAFDEATGDIRYHVQSTDADGTVHERVFDADALDLAP